MTESKTKEQTPAQGEADESKTAAAQEKKTFTEDEVNLIIRDRLNREKNKYADYADLKAAKAKLDEIEEAKLKDDEKAAKRLKELEDQIEAKEAELSGRILRDLKRAKIEQSIADNKMALPKGKTVDSLVKRMVGTTEEELDADIIDLIGYFPAPAANKGVGGGSQYPPGNEPSLDDLIAEAEAEAIKNPTSLAWAKVTHLKMKKQGVV